MKRKNKKGMRCREARVGLRSAVCGLRSDQRAFTLIELLLVVSVIGIIAALLLPAVNKVRDSARDRQASIETRILQQAIGAYILQERRFPAPDGEDGTPNHLGGGVDRTYGEDEPDGDNGVVMSILLAAAVDPPVLDKHQFRWDGDNVLNPWGLQYVIELQLSYSDQGKGYRVGANIP